MKINLDQMKDKLPKHVAIIMDGNRRWAKQKGWDVLRGHSWVVDNNLEQLIDRCIELEIPYLTLWVFSTENWRRSKREVSGLMKLFRKVLNKKMEDLHRKGMRLRVIGDLSRFPEDIRKKAEEWVEVSKENKKITVVLALNYGGRDEIIRAIGRMLEDMSERALQAAGNSSEQNRLRNTLLLPKEVPNLILSEDFLEKYLDTVGMPDPDLIIRTGGAIRTSGFMPWQAVYAEWYFTKTYMPDFGKEELDEALRDYLERERRFGK